MLCSFVAGAEPLPPAPPLPPDATYRPLPTLPLDAIRALDEADKPKPMQRQMSLLEQR
jgi:cytochrome c peroxidase